MQISAQSDFVTQQKRYSRVRAAISEKESIISNKLREAGIELNELEILIFAYKHEEELEIFARKKTESTYKKLITYGICANSGQLGPKKKQGDYQVPEGYYFIDRFNPSSSYYLSLGLNYPNLYDKSNSKFPNLGGDIFIHGSCVTIGCIPMTDDLIKEIYLYAINAKNNGQNRIPVYIFPFRMTEQNFIHFSEMNSYNTELIDFWSNIRLGYDKFITEKKELNVSVSKSGLYKFD